MHRSATALGAMIIGFGAVAVAIPTAAHAAPPVEHEHYEFSDSGTFDDCGFEIRFDASGHGNMLVREVPGSDGQAFFGHDNYSFRQILTNVETGEHFVVWGKGTFKETTAVHVGGDIWEFTAQDTGRSFVVEDGDGNVVLRDRGRVTLRVLFDTLGDGQPGGDVLEEEVTGVFGPHPALDAGFCEIATDLIG